MTGADRYQPIFNRMAKLLPIPRYGTRLSIYRESIRRAAFTACLTPHALECDLLGDLADREWPSLLNWLDTSGLSLYLFDQLTDSGRSDLLPVFAFGKLQRNLIDNMARTKAMIDELREINASFDVAGLFFTLLKGLSLYPLSVRWPWLRSQADIDFLIAERDAVRARQILENRGFQLHAISGRTWEFRTGPIHTATLENMYRPVPFRSVELHLEPPCAPQHSLLARREQFVYDRFTFTKLSPVDLMLGQGLHLYKHVCSEFFRASHVLEFHEHMVARNSDTEFWPRLRAEADRNSIAALKLGVVIFLAAKLCGRVEAAEHVGSERTPAAARFWVEQYGVGAIFGDAPGTKLYLLLQNVMAEAGVPSHRSTLRVLVPASLPRITTPPPNESWPDRFRRYRLQARFLRSRLRFHAIEGFRYICEAIIWSREREKSAQHQLFSTFRRQNKELTIR